jgi:ribosomal protein S27E
MAESLAAQFLHANLEVECPTCQYPIWVTWAEAVVQASILCPCCRDRIRLTDPEGGMQNAARVVEQQINEVLKGLQF